MSWGKVKLGDICTIEKGATGIQKAIEGDYPLVVTGEERKSHNEFQFDDEAVLIPLVSGTGHGHASLKRIHFQAGKFALGSILCAVIPKNKEQLSAEYLFRFLDLNKENELVARMKGMANVTLPMKEIAQIEIPLPKLKEQIEFVEKYKTLEICNKTLDSELNHQLTLLKQLRQQFLQEAVQGVLIKNEKLKDKNSETGAALLARIKAEKATAGKKEKPLPPIKKEEIPFDIPDDWVWCRLGEVCDKIHYGLNTSAKPEKKDVRLLRITDIQNNLVDWSTVPGCDYTKSDLENYQLFENDIVIARTGGTIGKTYIVKNIPIKSLFASYLIRAIPSKMLLSNYLKFFMESPIYWKQLYDAAWGAGQPNVNGTSLTNLYVPLPPLSIQGQIVEKVNRLMEICDAIEESIRASQKQNEGLLQAVLRAALAG